MKKGASVLLQQGVGLIIFIACVILTYNFIYGLMDSSDNELLQEYNSFLEEIAVQDVGTEQEIILNLPQNTALITFNNLAGFEYSAFDYGVVDGFWLKGNLMDRPNECNNLGTCTCFCTGVDPRRDDPINPGIINCEDLVCVQGDYSAPKETKMTDVFDDSKLKAPDTFSRDPLFTDRSDHKWVDSFIIIRSDEQSPTPVRVTRGGDFFARETLIDVSGYQGFIVSGQLSVKVKKVADPNVVQLCFKDNC